MPTLTATQVEETIVKALSTMGPEPEDITRDATFEALEVDSLDLAELSQIIDDEYGVELTGDDVGRIKTVGDAVDLIVATA
ncbi:MAG: acyl carrier protein [Solirubrobacterales bacterium]|nr:acyl carrier protein [Solirubrobacterales bacterium]